MTNRDIEAIKAAEILKQYCRNVGCADCIFYCCGSCILHGSGYYGFYKPYNWSTDLIKGE